MAKRLIATVALWVESFADGRPNRLPGRGPLPGMLEKGGRHLLFECVRGTGRGAY